MSVYDIAIGTNRKDRTPKQNKMEWPELVERLRNVTRATHSMEGYQKLQKAQRVDSKDYGYFIGGMTSGRKVTYRGVISLDIDEPKEDTLGKIRTFLNGCSYVIHSTHSSTPQEPRYRVVFPINRLLFVGQYDALMNILHKKLELPLDVSTFDFNRIMFLPSIPKDAEYFFEEGQGEPFDIGVLFDTNDEWRDLTETYVPKNTEVQDPVKKPGLIGGFCRMYTIRQAMKEFLSEIWTEESNGRYTLKGASTVGGGIIYEDKFLYSNHSTDKFLGRCHNAYDAVRLYKFGGGKTGDVSMLELCNALGIKADTGRAHKQTIEAIEDEQSKAILKEMLVVNNKGQLEKTISNAKLILEHDPNVRDIFAFDLFAETPCLKRTPPWRSLDFVVEDENCKNIKTYEEMTDVDESYLKLYFEQNYGLDPKPCLQDALNIVEHENAFHPVRDYLSSLEWDGVMRLEKIFIDCFGVADTRYAREVGQKFFTGAVRRVFIPGAKMDYVPVLVSKEGLGKSKFISRMAKLWGSDTFYTFDGSKEAFEQLRGVWIIEIPELNGVQKKSTNSRKAFVTKTKDKYRSAYLKYSRNYKRQGVFIASSNDMVFLDDPSEDGRRWWGLICDKERITINLHDEEFLDLVDKYWAEAVHYYKMGVIPMLSPEAEEEAGQLRIVHKAEDIEQGSLEDYLNLPVPNNWSELDIYERQQYIEGGVYEGQPRVYVCNAEVAREFFKYDRKDISPNVGRRVSEAIRRTDLFKQDGTKKRFGCYGSAIAWKRIKKLTVQQIKQILNEVNKK